MKKRLLLLALSLGFAACAAEDVDAIAGDNAYDDDVEVDAKEQALCAGPPAGYIKVAANNQGSWNGSASPSDFTYHSYNSALGQYRYYSPVLAMTRSVQGPCTSTGGATWQCGPGLGFAYTCPAPNSVAISSSTGWSDTGVGTSWTPGYKSNGCGQSYKIPYASWPVSGYQGKDTYSQPGGVNLLVCRYTPNLTPLKAL
jgi:hypothetical protein